MNDRAQEVQVVLNPGEVAASTKSQCLVKGILDVTMRRLHVSVLMLLADVDAMTRGTVLVGMAVVS